MQDSPTQSNEFPEKLPTRLQQQIKAHLEKHPNITGGTILTGFQLEKEDVAWIGAEKQEGKPLLQIQRVTKEGCTLATYNIY